MPPTVKDRRANQRSPPLRPPKWRITPPAQSALRAGLGEVAHPRINEMALYVDAPTSCGLIRLTSSCKDRKDCMRQFRAAWDRFSADPARLSEFLDMKRKRLRFQARPARTAARSCSSLFRGHESISPRAQPDQARRNCRAPASRAPRVPEAAGGETK